MTAATEFDFEMHSGDTKRLLVSIKNSAGAPVTLIGVASLKWWAAKKVTSTTYLTQKAVGTGVTVVDAPNGVLRIDIAPANTVGVSGDYYHELEVIDSAGDIQTVMNGTVTILKALVTNP